MKIFVLWATPLLYFISPKNLHIFFNFFPSNYVNNRNCEKPRLIFKNIKVVFWKLIFAKSTKTNLYNRCKKGQFRWIVIMKLLFFIAINCRVKKDKTLFLKTSKFSRIFFLFGEKWKPLYCNLIVLFLIWILN
jgi:hypothetical protein